MEKFKIFVVEDDNFYGSFIQYHLSQNPDFEVELYKTGKEVLDNLYKRPQAITLDYLLPDINGDKLLQQLKKDYPEIPVVIISGQEDIKTAIELLRKGAYDYLVKDDNTKDELWFVLNRIKENFELRQEISLLKEEVAQKYEFQNSIKGESQAIQQIFKLMEKAKNSSITISITGETGTGKELIAKALHYNSPRSKKPFVSVNMAAIPKDLMESELFGYEKGAFTGAINRRIGKFEEANNGTLFLDEIGELELSLQSKILRVLQEQEITRIGGSGVTKVNPRIIVATHKNLLEEVKTGNFREDLYYRLLGLQIELPPLRERGNDVLILAKHFADDYGKQNSIKRIVFDGEAQQKLLKYPYPGNIRELKAIVDLACVMADNNVIKAEDINFNPVNSEDLFFTEDITLKEYNNRIIKHYLNKFNNNVMTVAQKLDIGKSKIYQMIKNGDI